MTRGNTLVYLVLGLLLSGSVRGAVPHLSSEQMRELQSTPVDVIYMDPEEVLSLYLSLPAPPALPDDDSTEPSRGCYKGYPTGNNPNAGMAGNLAAGMLSGAIVGHYLSKAEARLEPYQQIVNDTKIVDREFAAASEAIGSVKWLATAPLERIESGEQAHTLDIYMRKPGPKAAVLLFPCTTLRDDANSIGVVFNFFIYEKDPYGPAGSYITLKNGAIGSDWTAGQKQGYSVINYQKSDQDLIMDKSVVQFFSDDGARFKQGFGTALAAAKTQLAQFFDGH